MKINHKDLQRLYKDFIRENIPGSRKSCPPLKEIIDSFKSELSEKRKTKIVDHTTHCCYCAQEFEFILQILRDELNLNEEIGKLLRAGEARTVTERKDGKTDNYPKKKKKLFFPILSWKYASLLIGVVIVIYAFFLIFHNIEEDREKRGEKLGQINLIEPINAKYSKSLLVFKWSEFEDSEYYLLEIFDETLYPIWKSDIIFKNDYSLPNETAKKLTKNRTYFWMITAFSSDGEKIESGIEKFTLID